jgi:hypothetical protein
MLNLNLNILGASNKPIVPIQPAPEPPTTTTTTTTTSTTTTSTTTTASPKFIPSNGLVQYLDATVVSSYPGSGSIWYDISGNGYSVSASYGKSFPTWNAANQQFNFNGVNQIAAVVAPTGSISTLSAFTWVKLATVTPSGSSAGEGVYGLSQPEFGAGQFNSIAFNENSASRWQVATENNLRDVVSPVQETSLEYMFIGMTVSSGSTKLWKNGSVLASGSRSVQTYSNTTVITVGQRHNEQGTYPSNGYLTGSVSMCLLYNRVLTDQEITNLYTQGR